MAAHRRVVAVSSLALYSARSSVRCHGRPSFGRLDDRLVFVFGSPRSGTTFLAGAIGSLPGFADLGEVNPLKAAIPDVSARDIRTILDRVRRLGLVGSRRAVEQTPETAFVLPAVRRRSRGRRSSTRCATAATSSARCSSAAG